MLRNYLISAYRNLAKTKVFTFINIMGLAIGMAACLLILHYVNFERSYDRFHVNSDRIYRLRYERTEQSGQAAARPRRRVSVVIIPRLKKSPVFSGTRPPYPTGT